MSMREEFEAWYLNRNYKDFQDLGKQWLEKLPDGDYLRSSASISWAAWKASRAALVVESCHTHPELILTDEDRAYEQGVQNQLSKIKAAGVQVKP